MQDCQTLHLVKRGLGWQLIDDGSNCAFASAVLSNDSSTIAFLASQSLSQDSIINQQTSYIMWSSDPQVERIENSSEQVETAFRTPLMLAAQSGAIGSLVTLLEIGADPRTRSLSDGATALTLAMTPDARSMPNSTSIIHVLETHPLLSQHQGSYANYGYPNQTFQHPAHPSQPYDSHGQGSIQYEAEPTSFASHHQLTPPPPEPDCRSEPLNPDFILSDDFRMFGFKVTRCPKRQASQPWRPSSPSNLNPHLLNPFPQSHDWRSCPYAHPTENARRRDPRQVLYCAIPCPDYKQGFCVRGEACHYSHGVYEAWLHPSKYRTQLCKDGPSCHRPICFFAHQAGELRAPSFTWMPPVVSSSLQGPQAGGGMGANGSLATSMGEHKASTRPSQQSTQVTNPSFAPPHQAPSSTRSGLKTPAGVLDLSHGPQTSSRGSSIISSTNKSSRMTHPLGMSLILNPDDTDLFPPLPDVHDAAASANAAALAASSSGIPWGSSGVLHNLNPMSHNEQIPMSSSIIHTIHASPPPSSIDSSEHTIMMMSAGAGGMMLGAESHRHGLVGNLAPPPLNPSGRVGGMGGAGHLAPRMSNAFARKHGLNPKDHGLVNLQKLAMQEAATALSTSTPHPQVHQHGHGFSAPGQRQGQSGGFQKTPGRTRDSSSSEISSRGRGARPEPPLFEQQGHVPAPQGQFFTASSIQPLPLLLPPELALYSSPSSSILPLSSSLMQPALLDLTCVIPSSMLNPSNLSPDISAEEFLDPGALDTPIGVSVVSATVLKALDADEEREATALGATLASVLSLNTQSHSPGKQVNSLSSSFRHVSAVI